MGETDLQIEPQNAATYFEKEFPLSESFWVYWARELSRFTKNRIDKIDEERKKAARARGRRATFVPER